MAKALMFDLGAVIMDIDFAASNAAFAEINVDFKRFHQLYQQDYSVITDYERGKVNCDHFLSSIRQALNVDPALSDQVFDQAWLRLIGDIPQRKWDLLKQLREQYHLILYSNTNASHLREIRRKYPQLESMFDAVYFSNEMGYRKPDEGGYRLILDEQGFKGSDVVFFDDLSQNIAGAKAFEISGHQVTEPDAFYSLVEQYLVTA